MGLIAFARFNWLIPSGLRKQIARQAAGTHVQIGRRARPAYPDVRTCGDGFAHSRRHRGHVHGHVAAVPRRYGIEGSSLLARIIARLID